MFTANQLVVHAIGDYIFQSHWMATNKTKNSWIAFLHAFTYTIPFVFLTRSWLALLVIFATHLVIDRFRLARYVNWFKNVIWDWNEEHEEWFHDVSHLTGKDGSMRPWVSKTGYPEMSPDWLSVWLFIITDNIMHIVINALCLGYL